MICPIFFMWNGKKRYKKQLPTRNTYSVISGVFFRGVELKVLSFSHPKIHSKDLWIVVNGPSSSLGRPSCTRSKWVIACARRQKERQKGMLYANNDLGPQTSSFPTKAIFIMTMVIIMMIMMNVPSSAYGAIIIHDHHHPCVTNHPYQHASWRCNAISSGSCPCISCWLF